MPTVQSFISNIRLPFLRTDNNVPELKVNTQESQPLLSSPVLDDKSDDDSYLNLLDPLNPLNNKDEFDLEGVLKEKQLLLSRSWSGSLVVLTALDPDKEITVDDSIVQESNKEIKQLTRDLVHLQDMLSDLNSILVIHREKLDKVESNVETTIINTEKSVIQLDSAVKEKVNGDELVTKIIAASLATVGVIGTVALIIVFI